jgi:D-alanine-D-alanine ligase
MNEQRRRLRVAVLFGSRSVEHEVSIISAVQAMDAMDPRRYEPLPIFITKEGRWLTGPELRRIDSYKDLPGLVSRCRPVQLRPEPFGSRLFMEEPGPLGSRRTRATVVDVFFPVVHGTFGEDGTLQGLLELAGVAYVGAGVVGSAVGMDKIVMKAAFQAQGLPTVNHIWFTRRRWQSAAADVAAEIERTLRYPLFVKPANLGSSIGITKATDRASLFEAVEVAAHYDRRLLVEESFEGGIEVNCSVLGNDDPQASVCEQPIRWTEILSYED